MTGSDQQLLAAVQEWQKEVPARKIPPAHTRRRMRAGNTGNELPLVSDPAEVRDVVAEQVVNEVLADPSAHLMTEELKMRKVAERAIEAYANLSGPEAVEMVQNNTSGGQ